MSCASARSCVFTGRVKTGNKPEYLKMWSTGGRPLAHRCHSLVPRASPSRMSACSKLTIRSQPVDFSGSVTLFPGVVQTGCNVFSVSQRRLAVASSASGQEANSSAARRYLALRD